jgi:hypothetical protein
MYSLKVQTLIGNQRLHGGLAWWNKKTSWPNAPITKVKCYKQENVKWNKVL